MDKEKQIEEMAQTLRNKRIAQGFTSFKCDIHCDICPSKQYYCVEREYAEVLYNAGYRKVDEKEMIVKKWDYNGLLQNKETLHKVYKAWDRSLEEQHQNTKELLNICTDKVRKETAKEILNSIIADDFYTGGSYELTFKDLRELAEKYGVKIEE